MENATIMAHRELITTNLHYMCDKSVSIDAVLGSLITAKVFTTFLADEIKSEKTAYSQFQKLYLSISKMLGSPGIFSSLINTLKTTGNTTIADRLDSPQGGAITSTVTVTDGQRVLNTNEQTNPSKELLVNRSHAEESMQGDEDEFGLRYNFNLLLEYLKCQTRFEVIITHPVSNC